VSDFGAREAVGGSWRQLGYGQSSDDAIC